MLEGMVPSVPNQKILDSELSKIRKLDDFDLVMLISEIHDHGWPMARRTLEMMPDGEVRPRKKRK
jgi:hypothetical protein